MKNITEMMSGKGCKCGSECISSFTPGEILDLMKENEARTPKERIGFYFDSLLAAWNPRTRTFGRLRVCGRECCVRAFIKINACGKSTFYSVRKLVQNGDKSYTPSKSCSSQKDHSHMVVCSLEKTCCLRSQTQRCDDVDLDPCRKILEPRSVSLEARTCCWSM